MNEPDHPGWKLSRECIRDAYIAKRTGVMHQPGLARQLTAACFSSLRRTQLAPHMETKMRANRYLEMQRQEKWCFMGYHINPTKLPSKQDVLDFLEENGAHDRSLAHIREQYEQDQGRDLMWHYPLSEGVHAGGFILPVQEGFLWLP